MLGLLLALVALAGAVPAAAAATVIVLSWDGTRNDYPDRVEVPALRRMERDGARARALVPVFPSNTFPNHVSLATGAPADRHGIVGNVFVDRVRGLYRYSDDASWIEAEPLWIAAERQGLRAATFFWVGSQSDWHGRGASYRRAPFDAELPEAAKVEQILAWLDLPQNERPQLIMAYWRGCDAVGHSLGPDAPEIAAQLRQQDAELGRLLAGLDARKAWPETTLLVVSDHGMAPTSQAIDLAAVLRKAKIGARVIPGGGVAHIALDDPQQREGALALLRAQPHVSAHPSAALPAELRARFDSRSGDLTALTEPPYEFREGGRPQPRPGAQGSGWGAHGYDPERPEMAAIFYALGRGVAPGTRIARVRAIDVAPTVAQLLGIDPPLQSEGRALTELGADTGK